MGKRFRIALAQINVAVGDLEGNRAKIIAYIRQAEKLGADLVAFPELVLSGYPPEDLLLKRYFNRNVAASLRKLTRGRFRPIVVVGYPHLGKKETNSAAVIQGSKLVASVDKFALPNYGVFDEKRYFTPGVRAFIFDLGFMRFGVNICEDIWVEPGISELLALHGADLLINISSSPFHVRKTRQRQHLVRELAKRTNCFVAYCNLVGGQDELVFDGASLVFGPNGKLLASGRSFEEDLVVADIDPQAHRAGKITFSLPVELPPVTKVDLSAFTLARKAGRSARQVAPALPREEEVYNALVMGTRDYLVKNGFRQVVIGLSGGIDSALTAAIASEAIGAQNVHLVFMPSRYTSRRSYRDAEKLSANLGAKLKVIAIDRLFAQYHEALQAEFAGLPQNIAEENLQARIRGNILMALSNKFGWLVLTTGNKSEISVGYCTLYGDTAGGFAVIRDVYKTLVFRLARFINRRARRALIPRSIITRPPSAELRPNQKDTDSLPPYEILDPILKLYIEDDLGQHEIVARGYDAKLVKRILHLVDSSEYKRRQTPPGVRITPKSFGRDRRMPITMKYLG